MIPTATPYAGAQQYASAMLDALRDALAAAVHAEARLDRPYLTGRASGGISDPRF